ncbi:MAG TPA: thioredoxin family protein [archaeon]|nr:thioredoxin family protein [archaeon]
MTITPSNYSVLKKGSRALDFNLPGTDGKNHSLAEASGKRATLIVFMCNHCPFVKPKMKYLKELFEKYDGKGLAMFGISSNDTEAYVEDDFEHMKIIAKEHGFRFPYLLDESQDVTRSYGAACTPDPFLFDSQLKLVYHGRIDDAHKEPHENAKTNELEQALKQVLAGQKITVKEEPSYGCNVKWKI